MQSLTMHANLLAQPNVLQPVGKNTRLPVKTVPSRYGLYYDEAYIALPPTTANDILAIRKSIAILLHAFNTLL